ncbi:unnamed protein product [Mucor hiemalis]
MNNRKNLTISTSTSTSTSSQWDELLETGNDNEDIFAPPSSPPPPHLIYIPENYRNAGMNSWQQNHNKEQPQSTPEKKKKNHALLRLLRSQLFLFAKKLTKIILQNNNLLLIANVVNKLWKARASFIDPFMFVVKNTIFIIRHDGYINLLKYTIHFVQYHLMDIFSKQQESLAVTSNVVSRINKRDPLTTAILLLKTTSHLTLVVRKIISKWLSHTIRNMGGLDSVILAISAVAFAKTMQKSDRIF